jgi:dihydrofolate reductase
MSRIIVEAEVSLDGVMGGDMDFWGQVFRYHSADVGEYLIDLLFAADTLLMGRVTYEGFAEVWPGREGKDADRINAMPKYVASRTLSEPLKWNSTLLGSDVAGEIGRLKAGASGDLLQYGTGELTRTMLENGLVDEVRIVVFPFTYGNGPRIFESMPLNDFQLLSTKTFESGAIALHYEPKRG